MRVTAPVWARRIGAIVCVALLAVSASVSSETYKAGVRMMRSGDPAGAAEAMEQALREDPRLIKAWLNLGIVRATMQDWAGAIEAYESLLAIEPRHAKALNNMANVYFRQGRYDEAGEWYAKALEVDPDYLLAAFHYGWVLRQQNRPEEAERYFGHCLKLEAKNDRERKTQLDSLFYLGTLRFRAGNYTEAAQAMERVLSVHRAHVEARYYLGISYRQLDRIDEAMEQLEIHRQLLAANRGAPVEKRPEP